MCIILGGSKSHPTDTKIFNIPVTLDNEDANLMIYKNRFQVNGQKDIMLVVVPTDKPVVGLVAYENSLKYLTTEIAKVGDNLIEYDKHKEVNWFRSDDTLARKKSATIHKVGNYNISVVYNVADVLMGIDWSTFNKPSDIDIRLNTISSKELFPFENKAIIICQAIQNIKDDGFGIVYFNNMFSIYFPICHENDVNIMNKQIKQYDVKLYQLHNTNTLPTKYVDFINGSRIQYEDFVGIVNIGKPNKVKRFIDEFPSMTHFDYFKSAYNEVNDTTVNRPLVGFTIDNVVMTNDTTACLKIKPFKYISCLPIKTYGSNQNIIEEMEPTIIKHTIEPEVSIFSYLFSFFTHRK